MKDMENIKMTQTGLLPGKKGKIVHVCFERRISSPPLQKRGALSDYAEIVMPSGRILSNRGFLEEELAQFQIYLKIHKHDIYMKAKQINHDIIYKL